MSKRIKDAADVIVSKEWEMNVHFKSGTIKTLSGEGVPPSLNELSSKSYPWKRFLVFNTHDDIKASLLNVNNIEFIDLKY